MADLIDRTELLEWLTSNSGFRANCEDCTSIDCLDCIVEEAIKNATTVDAAPVVHGRWVWVTEDVYRCTNCGSEPHVQEVMGMPDYDFCPFCGAKMDRGGEDGKGD